MWEVPLGPQKLENLLNKILAQTSKPELAKFLHAALFIPTKASLLKVIKPCFLKTWPGLTTKLINKHLEKSINTTMGHLHMRRQGLQSTKEKPPDTDLENKITTNVVYFTTVEPSTTKEGKIYSDLCRRFPTTSSRGNKYIYAIYVYDCNAIITTEMKNKRDNEMVRDFTSLTEDIKSEESTQVSISWTTKHILP